MEPKFRKLRIGFVTLVLEFLEGQDIAVKIAENIKKYLIDNLNVDLVDYPKPIAKRKQAIETWKLFKAKDVDAVILFNGTFSTGEITAEIIRNYEVPYLLWGIEELAINKKSFTGSMVGVMAAGTLFKNLERRFSFIYGLLDNEDTKNKLMVFIKAVRAMAYLKEAKIAVIGMRPDGFEISDFDELAIKKLFGTEITKLSLYTLSKIMKQITDKEIDRDMEIQKGIFEIQEKDLNEARGLSRVYLAIKKYVTENNIQSYAPDCWPELRDIDKTPICPANGRMNAEGVMASCECDVDGSLTLMMEYAITGTAPWWADFVNYIPEADALLWWHCGNAPYTLSPKKPKIERVFGGLSQTSSLKEGEATICRMNSIRGKYTIHAGVGHVIEHEPLLKGSNLTIRMKGGNFPFIQSLINNGIPHHNGIVYGNIIPEIKEFAHLMNIPIVVQE